MQQTEISWNEVDHHCRLLANRIAKTVVQTEVQCGLLFVARGGLVLGRMIDGYLRKQGFQLPIGFVQARSYKAIGKIDSAIEMSTVFWPELSIPKLIFIIDDIADTGRTLETVSHLFGEGHNGGIMTVCMFYKAQSTVQPSIYSCMVDDDEWITFPYETEDTRRDEICD